MMRLLNLVLPVLVAYCFWRWVGFAHLGLTLSQLTSGLSIFIAAVLVRLARGMPTLDWKSIPIEKRRGLTSDLVDVSREYAGLLVLLMLLLVVVVVTGGLTSWLDTAGSAWARAASATNGFLITLSVLRFGYVVWRDLDIVTLQKVVIDEMADQEQEQRKLSLAQEKLTKMRQASLSGGAAPSVEVFEEEERL